MKWTAFSIYLIAFVTIASSFAGKSEDIVKYQKYKTEISVFCILGRSYHQDTGPLSSSQFCSALGDFMATMKAEQEHPHWFPR